MLSSAYCPCLDVDRYLQRFLPEGQSGRVGFLFQDLHSIAMSVSLFLMKGPDKDDQWLGKMGRQVPNPPRETRSTTWLPTAAYVF